MKFLKVTLVIALILLSFAFINAAGFGGMDFSLEAVLELGIIMAAIGLVLYFINKRGIINHSDTEKKIYRVLGVTCIILGVFMSFSYYSSNEISSLSFGILLVVWGVGIRARNVVCGNPKI